MIKLNKNNFNSPLPEEIINIILNYGNDKCIKFSVYRLYINMLLNISSSIIPLKYDNLLFLDHFKYYIIQLEEICKVPVKIKMYNYIPCNLKKDTDEKYHLHQNINNNHKKYCNKYKKNYR